MNKPRVFTATLALAAALALGCASMGPPNDAISAAELSIRQADDALASQHAPLDLVKSREKLEQAKRAVAEGDNAEARRLAEQSQVDAKLAEEKSLAAKAKRTAQEMERSVTTIRQETERYAPVRQ